MSDDIFADPALPKAFYHPSRARNVSHHKDAARLSPNRFGEEDASQLRESYLDSEFLKGGHTYKKRLATTKDLERMATLGDTSSKFDESWPASERPSTVGIPDLDDSEFKMFGEQLKKHSTHGHESNTRERSGQKGYTFQFPERDTNVEKYPKASTEASTLAKYIERFRYGQPMSRKERENKPDITDDFWWLSKTEPSDTSTPNDGEGRTVKTKRRTPRDDNKENMKKHMSLGDYMKSAKGSLLDEDLKSLHEKAERLLERTGSSLNSSEPIVSTDGLGSTSGGSSGTPGSVQEQPYRPEFIKKKDSALFVKPLNPEDDILTQWRRRRKMELMKSNDPILGRAAKNADHELESKLSAFRKRLDATLKESSEPINQHPLPSQETIKLRERLFNHQPASTVNVPLNHGMFTPAPQPKNVSTTECQTSPQNFTSPVVKTKHHHSPIASPNLPHRIVSTNDGSLPPQYNPPVEPHMHLSCDIIPCPVAHSSSYGRTDKHNLHEDRKCTERIRKEKGSLRNSNCNNSHEMHNCGKSSDSRLNEDYHVNNTHQRNNKHGGLPHVYDDSDSSFEMMKIKHLKLLKQEQSLRKDRHNIVKHTGYNYKEMGSKLNVNDVSFDSETEGSRINGFPENDAYKFRQENDQTHRSKGDGKSLKENRSVKSGKKDNQSHTDMSNEISHPMKTNERRSKYRNKDDRNNSRTTHTDIDIMKSSSDSLTDVTGLDPSKLEISNYGKVTGDRDRSSTKQEGRKHVYVKHNRIPQHKHQDFMGDSPREKSEKENYRLNVKSKERYDDETETSHKTTSKHYKDHQYMKKPLSLEEGSDTVPTQLRESPGGPTKSVSLNKPLPLSSPSPKIPPPKQSMEGPEFGALKSGKRDRRLNNRKGPTGHQPMHSSPMPSINSAIGQAVGEHLFISSVSFASSVDSLQHSQVNASNTTIHEQPEPLNQDDFDIDKELLSDGEEYPDDEILQDLRKRRIQFLERLKEIDDVIEGKCT